MGFLRYTSESPECHSRKLHSHPKQHTEEELILIHNMRRRNPKPGIVELWARLRDHGYKLRRKYVESAAPRGTGGERKT